MKKTFIGGISFKRRNAEYCELKEVAPESVVLEAESERMLPIKEGDTLGKGSLMFKENNASAAVFCGINGEVEKIVSENEKVSITVKASEVEADEITHDPIDKTISECLPFELCTKLLSMGIDPPKVSYNTDHFDSNTMLAQCAPDGSTIYVKEPESINPDILFAIAHELRHVWQIRTDKKKYLGDYRPVNLCKSLEEYNLQESEIDANAFAAAVMYELFDLRPLFSNLPEKVRDTIWDWSKYFFSERI